MLDLDRLRQGWPDLLRAIELGEYALLDQLLAEYGLIALGDGGRISGMTPEAAAAFQQQFLLRQQSAVERGLPPVLVSSMPKSASVFLVYRLAEALDIPVGSVTHHGCRCRLMSSVLANFARGGAINHDHFLATPFNMMQLSRAGITRLIVQLRDPRDAFVSMCHLVAKNMSRTPDDIRRAGFPFIFSGLTEHLRSWAIFLRDNRQIETKVVWFEDLTRTPREVMADVVDFVGLPHALAAVGDVLDRHANVVGELNFRRGDAGQWQTFLTDAEAAVADAALAALAADTDSPKLDLRSRLNLPR